MPVFVKGNALKAVPMHSLNLSFVLIIIKKSILVELFIFTEETYSQKNSID